MTNNKPDISTKLSKTRKENDSGYRPGNGAWSRKIRACRRTGRASPAGAVTLGIC